jgi:hypothetical protein
MPRTGSVLRGRWRASVRPDKIKLTHCRRRWGTWLRLVSASADRDGPDRPFRRRPQSWPHVGLPGVGFSSRLCDFSWRNSALGYACEISRHRVPEWLRQRCDISSGPPRLPAGLRQRSELLAVVVSPWSSYQRNHRCTACRETSKRLATMIAASRRAMAGPGLDSIRSVARA